MREELIGISKSLIAVPSEMGGNGLGYPPQKVYNIGLQVNF